MAKSKRSRKGNVHATRVPVTRPSTAASDRPSQVVLPPQAPAGGPRTRGATPDFTEYRYVVGDLKRIGFLAVAMFATLIVLALLIR